MNILNHNGINFNGVTDDGMKNIYCKSQTQEKKKKKERKNRWEKCMREREGKNCKIRRLRVFTSPRHVIIINERMRQCLRVCVFVHKLLPHYNLRIKKLCSVATLLLFTFA